MKTIQATLMAALAVTALQASAQKLTPGLWENTTTIKGQGGENADKMAKMQAELAKMPPEQRKAMEKMMEQMMASRGGANTAGVNPMDLLAGKPTTMRTCITPEQAARDFVMPLESRCKTDQIERNGATVRAKISCSGDPPMTADAEYTLSGDKAFSGRAQLQTMRKGQAERMEVSSTGRWLAADCGGVKPMGTLPTSGSSAPPPAPPAK
jgi:Protein of unknown function (DUF3617)